MNEKLIRKLGLLGIVSLLSYTAAVVLSPLAYPGYNWISQAVSDLSADSAPSRVLREQLGAFYMPCGIVCVTMCCVTIKEHYNRVLRMGVYLFAIMNWISAGGTAILPHNYFGIPERISVFAASGFTAVLGVYQNMGWKGKENLSRRRKK